MINVCVIGLGYVGLPILINLSKKFKTIGYDINKQRVEDLKKGKDLFNEFRKKTLKKSKINFTNSINLIKKSNIFIITVPTPINKKKQPDLTHLKDVCNKLSKIIKKKDIIIFESTVYPGLTNDFCIPLIEKNNNFKEGVDFYVGYSPERVNPGDKIHSLKNINKILAYPHNYLKKELIKVYSLISKKIILSNNIRETETAKVIENIQRDVNIGLINEFYLVCKRLNLDFNNVINLASSKWNFIKFKPGLVGGHCLPVDPYYFSFISKKNKLNTKITLAGRTINNLMTTVVKKEITEKLKKIDPQKNKKILFCGLTYKKNVADLRNSLSLKIFQSLKKNNKKIRGYDPLLNNLISKKNNLVISLKEFKSFDIYILVTNHSIISRNLKKLNKNKTIINILD
tara:strand:- start:1574 stop:2773 length:1200 start_codon:yes stop_codon:yes gene_type:complete